MVNKSRILIKDLRDPVGFTISLVENPCVDNSCDIASSSTKKVNKSSNKGTPVFKSIEHYMGRTSKGRPLKKE